MPIPEKKKDRKERPPKEDGGVKKTQHLTGIERGTPREDNAEPRWLRKELATVLKRDWPRTH